MSVFQLQEWWGVTMAQGEEFDHGGMAIGNVDNARPPSEKIAVGSLQGMLRIYHPSRPQYRVEDLVLEESLGSPILQLLIGKFIPSNDILGLAVLHPRTLTVYEVLPQGNKDGRVNYYSLRKAYTHDLGLDGKHFTAYNMSSGRFGGVSGRDMFIVQSLDGKVQILEQSANAFTRQLADCLIPGPVVYVPKVDAFVTVNHACQAECYRYQVLANSQSDIGSSGSSVGVGISNGMNGVGSNSSGNSSGNSSAESEAKTGSFGLRSIRSAMVEWSLNIGEPCRQIIEGCFSLSSTPDSDNISVTTTTTPNTSTAVAVAAVDSNAVIDSRSGLRVDRVKARPSELLLLCDKSIFLLKSESGGIVQQRRLDRADASCLCIVPSSTHQQQDNNSYNNSNNSNAPVVGSNFLVATQDNTLLVFSAFNLVWTAKLPFTPVQLAVAQFGNQRGLVAAIDDSGTLSVCYLGTRPPVTAVLSQVRELNYDKVEEEHRALLQIIRDSQSDNRVDSQERLHIRPQYPKSIDLESPLPAAVAGAGFPRNELAPLFMSSLGGHDGAFVRILVRLYLSYSSPQPATNVNIVVTAPQFIYVTPSEVTLPKVAGVKSTPILVKIHFYALKTQLPTTLEALITASYTSPSGEPRVTSVPLKLPLFMAVRPKPPVKSANCKVVLDTAFAAQPLTELFGDYLYAYQQSGMDVSELLGANAVQAMGFQLLCNSSSNNHNSSSSSSTDGGYGRSLNTPTAAGKPQSNVVSILVSKNAGRYRVQAESFSALAIVLDELEKRLHQRLASPQQQQQQQQEQLADGTTAVATAAAGAVVVVGEDYPVNTDDVSIVKCSESLPLEQYFALIESHYKTRVKTAALTSQLNDAAHQFRMVEKRLLVRFKDRNPTPLTGLDTLLNETYRRIVTLSDEIEVQQQQQRAFLAELDGFSRVLAAVAGLKFGLTFGDRQLLRAYLSPQLREGSDQGWEETVNASITLLLKTSLAKNTKDSATLSSTKFELPSSIEPLKKHLLLLFDRLEKGGRISVATSPRGGATVVSGAPLPLAAAASNNSSSSRK